MVLYLQGCCAGIYLFFAACARINLRQPGNDESERISTATVQ